MDLKSKVKDKTPISIVETVSKEPIPKIDESTTEPKETKESKREPKELKEPKDVKELKEPKEFKESKLLKKEPKNTVAVEEKSKQKEATPTKRKQKPNLPPVDTSAPPKDLDEEDITAIPSIATGKKQVPTLRIISGIQTPVKQKSAQIPIPDSAVTWETASVTTGPSRPVTPPPGFGAGPGKKDKDLLLSGPASSHEPAVTHKSKAALKKERIAAAKEKERKALETAAADAAREKAAEKPSDIVAPIMGRMKKKEKKKKAGDRTTAADEGFSEKADDDDVASVKAEITTKAGVETPKHVASKNASPEPPTSPAASTGVSKTGAQILAELQADQDNHAFNPKELELFKLPVGHKWDHYVSPEDIAKVKSSIPPLDAPPPPADVPFTPAPASEGYMHLTLRGGGTFETRVIVTPHGSVLRGLAPAAEARYLELEERNRATPAWARWTSPKAAIAAALDAEDLIAVSGLPPDWKASLTTTNPTAADEATRLSTKEALDYLWNTVMPALPGYAQEHLEGLAQSMAVDGCKVSLGFEDAGRAHGQEPTVTVDVKVHATGNKPVDVKEWERRYQASKKETEVMEKKLEKLIKRNRKVAGL
ncbi:hypothetical protein EDC01DRAFT_781598 [Geopyxis carbonaria]|nr:hypothetical protein EDC01DRAFT_781598 [Geopyxis carbonaria]